MSSPAGLAPESIGALTLADHELFHDRRGRPRPLPRPLGPLADTHGHLTALREHEAPVALCRAALAGVRLLVVPVDPVDEFPRRFADVPSFLSWLQGQVEEAAGLLDKCAGHGMVPPSFEGVEGSLLDRVRFVAGVHPYGAADLDEGAWARLEALLDSPACVGVGEIGIDLGPHNVLPADVEERAFRRQLRVAHEHHLPVELHVRDGEGTTDAHDRAARVLVEEGVPEAGCDLHCFTQGPEVMAPFVGLGCHVAFGGALTFSRSDDIRAAAASCPARLVISETDSPYMAPVPLRGRECEPAMVAFVASAIADVRARAGLGTRESAYQLLWDNARGLFDL